MRLTRLITLAALLPVLALAKPSDYGRVTVDLVNSVYDADTFRVTVKSWPAIVGDNMPIRLNGVDAAEIRGKCAEEKARARAARDFTREQLNQAKTIELRNIRRGKYFRILSDVFVDGVDLAALLIQHNHARPYQGGKREGWCSPE